MKISVRVPAGLGGFTENKELAKEIRINKILPALERGEQVVLDFSDINYATQSFIHALIGEAIRKYGERTLDLVEFRHCSASLRSVIELVVDYSLGGFPQHQTSG